MIVVLIPDRQAVAQSPTATPVSEKASTDVPRILSLHERKFSIDLSRYPVSGSVSAKNVVVIISDFTCPHSLETEKAFIDALDGFKPGDVALVHLPGVREKKYGPSIHKIMLSLWQEHPAIYRRLCDLLIYEELPPDATKVRAAAVTALGSPELLDALLRKHGAWAETQIQQTLELMSANADSPSDVALPQVMIGPKLITGSVPDPAKLQHAVQAAFGITPTRAVYAVKQSPPNLNDPCEPSTRKSCGRLVISMIAAGEYSNKPHPNDETVPGDKHGADASNHLLQFTGGANSKLTSKHILLTSDPDVKEWIAGLPFNKRVSLAGIVDASLPAFERMVSAESKDSPLNTALAEFAKNKDCQRLMNKSSSVLPYLKVDIVIDGELAESARSSKEKPEYGIPVFEKEGTVGTLERWLKEGNVLGVDRLRLLMKRLDGSLMHVFVKTCKAGLVGNIFDAAIKDTGICGCFVGDTDEEQNGFSGKGVSAPFNYAMSSPAAYEIPSQQVVFGRWKAEANMTGLTRLLLERNQIVIMNPPDAKSGTVNLRNIVNYRNPLFGFVYTSADALTNRALTLLRTHSGTASVAKKIADSEFSNEIKDVQIRAYTGNTRPNEMDSDMVRIMVKLDEIKRELGSMIDVDPRAKLDSSAYKRETDKYKACLSSSASAPAFCSVFKGLFDTINGKVLSKTDLTPDEDVFYNQYVKVTEYWSEIKFSTMWPRYIAGEIVIDEFLTKMAEAKKVFLDFKEGVEPLYTKKPGVHPSGEEERKMETRRQAFTYLNKCFESAFESARIQMFDLLKRESITTKIERTEAAINLLAQNVDSIKPAGEGERLIAELASKLNCLTRYTVGPAHDNNPPGPIIPYQAKR